ncbi:hypothetical protein [Nostoc sp. CCY 9925]
MQAAHCGLVIALQYAPIEEEEKSVRQHLQRAIVLSGEHYKQS